jgi:hypothetical protein
MTKLVIPGEREAKLSAREGDPTSSRATMTSWVPFPHIGARTPMFAGNDMGTWSNIAAATRA